MATTVTYKNDTLTTLGNGDTKTLKTAGTYLEDDIEISEVVNLQSLSVTPSTSQQVFDDSPIDTQVYYNYNAWNDNAAYGSKALSANLGNSFTNGDIVYINLTLGLYNSGLSTNVTVTKTFTWTGERYSWTEITNHYRNSGTTTATYVITITSTTITLTLQQVMRDNSVLSGYAMGHRITVYKRVEGPDGYCPVTVAAIPSNYIIPTGTLNISANGTYDVSNYASAEVAVAGGASLQAKTVTPTTSNQTVTADSGYDGLSTVTVSAMPTGTTTAPTSISGTAATVSTGTNTLTLTKSVSVTPRVTTAGYVSAGTAGNSSVSLTANVTTKAAATITPGTSNQTIAANTYLTGAQTIAGDANLVGSNILSGVSIFGVPGTVNVVSYRSGTAAPASSLGSDGDIYLQLAQ